MQSNVLQMTNAVEAQISTLQIGEQRLLLEILTCLYCKGLAWHYAYTWSYPEGLVDPTAFSRITPILEQLESLDNASKLCVIGDLAFQLMRLERAETDIETV